ncbi:MAG: hypothetical protein EP328_10090, partial [Gammaproteobacteria bacterium]
MTLEEVFEQLSAGELAQVFLAEGGTGEVPKEKRLQVLAHIKLGLTALHKRFLLREGTITIGLVEGQQKYVIDKLYAASNTKSTAPVKYIQDSADPYLSDLLKIERVYAEDGTELSLNVVDDPDSAFTPNFKTLVLPEDLEGTTVKVVYRADHPVIDPILAKAVPFKVEIELPPGHLEPLLYFVASRVMNPIGMTNDFHDGNNFAAKYEMACQQLE